VNSPKEVDDDLGKEVKEEVSKYGEVKHMIIINEENEITRTIEVKIFILYSNLFGAINAVEKLNNRYFAKRLIACNYYSEAGFMRLKEE